MVSVDRLWDIKFFSDGTVRFFHTRKGTWIDSEAEVALKTLVNALKTFGARRNCIDAGLTHLKLMDALKKEFKHLRNVWMLLKEQVMSIVDSVVFVLNVFIEMRRCKPWMSSAWRRRGCGCARKEMTQHKQVSSKWEA